MSKALKKISGLTIEEFENIIQKIIEDEMEDLYFIFDPSIKSKIEKGLKDIREGKTISLDNVIAQRKTK